MRQLWWSLSGSVAVLRRWLDEWVLGDKHALYGAAAARIGTGIAVLGLLLSNLSSRDMWVGQASVWAEPARSISNFPEIAVLKNVSGDVLTVFYFVTMVAALAFVLGWHTKAANIVTFVGFIAIVAQNPVVGLAGDNLIRVSLLWMLLMRTAEHWSLDVRRRSRHQEGEPARHGWDDDVLPHWLSTSLHNLGLAGLAVQTIVAYMAAGLDKVGQSVWQHGTALYYTMQLPESRPFPALSDALSSSRFILALLTYAVLLVQLFFGPLLLNPISRRVLLFLAVVVNVVFAVIFAAPWSATAIIAVTLLFGSTRGYEWFDDWIRYVSDPVTGWVTDRGYAVADAFDDVRHRAIYPVTDWIKFTIFRR